MKVLSAATVTAAGEPRISALDGHFLHGTWTFSTATTRPRRGTSRPPGRQRRPPRRRGAGGVHPRARRGAGRVRRRRDRGALDGPLRLVPVHLGRRDHVPAPTALRPRLRRRPACSPRAPRPPGLTRRGRGRVGGSGVAPTGGYGAAWRPEDRARSRAIHGAHGSEGRAGTPLYRRRGGRHDPSRPIRTASPIRRRERTRTRRRTAAAPAAARSSPEPVPPPSPAPPPSPPAWRPTRRRVPSPPPAAAAGAARRRRHRSTPPSSPTSRTPPPARSG